jgi:hypothetical protein
MADYLQGYQTVPDSGTPIPAPCGTEEANEGKGTDNRWAKRKYRSAPADYSKKYPQGNE